MQENLKEPIHGMFSHFDIGECLECLVKDYGENWKDHATDYSSPKMPRDFNHNGYCGFIENDYECNIVCHKCSAVWNRRSKVWEKRR